MDAQFLLNMHKLMLKARVLEERLIKTYKLGEALFWIGGPGEEAFGVPLGLLVHKGQGHEYDWLHLHYRCTPTLVAMGLDFKTALRLIMNRATDPCSGGRNFSSHYCFPQWNVAPVSSPIGVQYSMAIGTAWQQRRQQGKAITIVTGGDAGTAEGDFASSLVWASRKGQELPMLITVQNNNWGISTDYASQHGEEKISDRAKAFAIKNIKVNSQDPVEVYTQLKKAIEYVRHTRKPFVFEVMVGRLYGHSSATGANKIQGEFDCLQQFEKHLHDKKVLSQTEAQKLRRDLEQQAFQCFNEVLEEPSPEGDTVWQHTYSNNIEADWRKF